MCWKGNTLYKVLWLFVGIYSSFAPWISCRILPLGSDPDPDFWYASKPSCKFGSMISVGHKRIKVFITMLELFYEKPFAQVMCGWTGFGHYQNPWPFWYRRHWQPKCHFPDPIEVEPDVWPYLLFLCCWSEGDISRFLWLKLGFSFYSLSIFTLDCFLTLHCNFFYGGPFLPIRRGEHAADPFACHYISYRIVLESATNHRRRSLLQRRHRCVHLQRRIPYKIFFNLTHSSANLPGNSECQPRLIRNLYSEPTNYAI